jgi:hypothetical protein
LIREFLLRIFVKAPHEAVGRRIVKVVKVVLHILTMIPLRVGQPEGPFFEDRILAVPEGSGEAESAIDIAENEQAVFAPAIDAGASMIVRKIVPGIAIRRVVLPHRSPLALAEIGSPKLPSFTPLIACEDTLGFSFGGHFGFSACQKKSPMSL